MLEEKIVGIRTRALEELAQCADAAQLKTWENSYLSRKSEFNQILKDLKNLSPEERKKIGSLANETRAMLERAYGERSAALLSSPTAWEEERIDVTLPGKKFPLGHLHPITQVQARIEDIFVSMGFAVADGPEVESEWYNFDALNFPKNHPARDMQDTFWVDGKFGKDKYVLRTHTSPVQIRYMETHKPPFRIIVPGRFFRNEATDASHETNAHQFECLMVGTNVSVAHFKYIAEQFFSAFFGRKIAVRLRPSFFPFTEPSFEFDINCILCRGEGCSACKGSGWLEIGGAGMVHQKVFQAAGYPRGKYQGFAWGFGLSRLAMMKYQINDVRLFMSGDLRFIRQF